MSMPRPLPLFSIARVLVPLTMLLIVATCMRPRWQPTVSRVVFSTTTEDRVEQYGAAVDERLAPAFKNAGLDYPPTKIALVALKKEAELELWASQDDTWHLIKTYAIQGQSGGPGPKLREGDRQVPEGIYRISALNPNSSYHLSLRVNYPNQLDLTWAKQDGRSNPGSDIFIHGGSASIGCLAMGGSGGGGAVCHRGASVAGACGDSHCSPGYAWS